MSDGADVSGEMTEDDYRIEFRQQVAAHARPLGHAIIDYGGNHGLHPSAMIAILLNTLAAVIVSNLKDGVSLEEAVGQITDELMSKCEEARGLEGLDDLDVMLPEGNA